MGCRCDSGLHRRAGRPRLRTAPQGLHFCARPPDCPARVCRPNFPMTFSLLSPQASDFEDMQALGAYLRYLGRSPTAPHPHLLPAPRAAAQPRELERRDRCRLREADSLVARQQCHGARGAPPVQAPVAPPPCAPPAPAPRLLCDPWARWRLAPRRAGRLRGAIHGGVPGCLQHLNVCRGRGGHPPLPFRPPTLQTSPHLGGRAGHARERAPR